MKKLLVSLLVIAVLACSTFATVTNESRKISYVVDATSEFTYAYTFAITSPSTVFLSFFDTDGTEVAVPMTRTTSSTPAANEYYVDENNSSIVIGDDGSATLQDKYGATITQLLITRTVDFTQESAFPTATSLQSTAIENALDKNTMISQQLSETISRALVIPIQDDSSQVVDLPAAAIRANKFLAFDALGNPTAGDTPAGSVIVSSAMEPVVGAATIPVAKALMNLDHAFNVSDYGATGDGVTDDTTAIQAAIDAASTLEVVRVYIPSTTEKYIISAALTIPNNVWLVSDGAEIELKASSNDNMIENSGTSNIRVIGLHLDGNGGNQTAETYYAVYFDTVSNCKVLDCTIEDTSHTGIILIDCTRIEVSGNRVTTSDLHGIALSDCTTGIVSNNECYSNGHSGIHTTGTASYKLRILGNTCYENGTTTAHHGIYVSFANDSVVNSNVSYENTGDGILVRESVDISITGNNCYLNGRMGVYFASSVTTATKCAITGNSCRSNVNHGISAGADVGMTIVYVTITGNYVGGSGGRGINLQRCSNSVVSSNVIENCNDEGIRITHASNENIASNNVIKDCSQDGSANFSGIGLYETSVRNTIQNNFIKGTNHAYGVAEFSSSDLNYMTNNVVLSPVTGTFLIAGANTVVRGNKASVVLTTTFTSADATPTVDSMTFALTNATGVTVTRFDNGVVGQEITLISGGATVYDTSSASRLIGSSVDITTAAGDITTWICTVGGTTSSVWRLKGFVDISVNNSAGA